MLLPVGNEDFREVIENKKLFFVDKTLFIKEMLDDIATKIAVITRPRRFGKTLNLSMLHHFLAAKVGKNSTKGLFDNLNIAQCGQEYMEQQGKYPVVFLTFKEVADTNYELAAKDIAKLISDLYLQHDYLLESDKLKEQHKINFKAIVNGTADKAVLKASLKDLTGYLYLHTQTKPWILIDEYDAPIQAAYTKGYYDEMIGFMRGLLGAALKSNFSLHRAVLTGIFRIAKESLFSGLNNVTVYTLLNDEYSQHFGFTEAEIEAILKQANLADKADAIKQWYNGYQIGDSVIYNPWSIATCIKKRGETEPYWLNPSENKLIKDLLKTSPIDFKKNFESLICGGSVEKIIDENMVFQYLNHNMDAVWSLLLMAGYLKPLTSHQTGQGTSCALTIPNQEVRHVYRKIVEQWLSNGHGINWYNEFLNALLTGNMEEFQLRLQNVMLQIASYHDFAREPEAFYHGLMIGFTVSLHNTGKYEVCSNRESGFGRFDIMLIPDDKTKLGIIMELKNCPRSPNVGAKNLSPKMRIPENNNENQNLMKLAKEALQQIDEKKYSEEFKQRGIPNILKIGIGFRGKEFELVSSIT